MKNRKKGTNVLVILLICALGIGYAAATDIININGSASAIAGDFVIEFDTAHTPETTKTGTNTAVVASYTNADIAVMTVTNLQKVNDAATAVYKITNNSSALKANITTNLTGDIVSDTHYSVELTYSTDGTTFNTVLPTNVAAGASVYVKAEVKLLQAFADAAAAKTFTIAVTGTATE